MEAIRKIFLIMLFLSTLSLSAQDLQDYIDDENVRIAKAQEVEDEIATFIADSLDSYALNQDLVDEIIAKLATGENDHGIAELTEEEFEGLLKSHKRIELRKLYFELHPDVLPLFEASPMPSALQACFNGGFEDGLGTYTFASHETGFTVALTGACESGTAVVNPFVPPAATNQTLERASIVTPGDETILAALTPPIHINRVRTGNRALKINPSPLFAPGEWFWFGQPWYDGETGNYTIVTKTFTVNDADINFHYLMVGQETFDHVPAEFNVRLFNVTDNQPVANSDTCFKFQQTQCNDLEKVPDNRPWPTSLGIEDIVYTPDWRCHSIHMGEGLIGDQVRIEFRVSDCFARGHFGVVYIDDICGMTECPVVETGSLHITPLSPELINCPSEPFQVCGNFTLPENATGLNSLQLQVINSSNMAVSTQNSTSLTSPFCFTIDPAVAFGTNPTDTYTIRVRAVDNNFACDPDELVDAVSVSYEECCEPTLVETGLFSGFKTKQRSISITTTEQITGPDFDTQVIYHAEQFLELRPGFETINRPEFVAYIAECYSGFDYRLSAQQSQSTAVKEKARIKKITGPVKTESNIRVYPNPSSSSVTVEYIAALKRISILSMDGKKMIDQKVYGNQQNVDVSGLSDGIYIISVETKDEKILRTKFIKN
jgi:hypothetical protein